METKRENYDSLFAELAQEAPQQPEARQPVDKEAWAAAQKAQREELYALADQMADRALSDPAILRQYIETQARLGGESTTNTLILMEKYPEASHTRTFEEWHRMDRSVKPGEQAISLLSRGREYVREDGTKGAYMQTRKVFDVRQTTGRALRQQPVHATFNRIKALMTDTPVPVRLSDAVPGGVGAQYNAEKGVVEVARGLDGNALFFSVARELARANENLDTFQADCVANTLCCRYGMEPRFPDRIHESFAALEPAEKRQLLSNVRAAAWEMEKRIDRNLEQMVKTQEKRQDAPAR